MEMEIGVPDITPEVVRTLTEFLEHPDRPAGTLSYTALRGYLFAVANAPDVLMPSAWIDGVWGGGQVVWEDEGEAKVVFGAILAVWTDVAGIPEGEELTTGWLFGAGADTTTSEAALRREWSRGFHLGFEQAGEVWAPLLEVLDPDDGSERIAVALTCLQYFHDPEHYQRLWNIPDERAAETASGLESIFLDAAILYAQLGRTAMRARTQSRRMHRPAEPIRREEQPGRNEPCPCGSGKKYKKCCLSPHHV